MSQRKQESVNAVINLDKPTGMSSQEAVTKVKRIFKVKKAGHAGTLDPMATGVLLVCLGEATKLSRFLMDTKKEYLGTLKFGERTDTLDSEGVVTETIATELISEQRISDALVPFRGEIMQIPPMYSALKRDGQPLYKLAREGIEVAREERGVTIYALEIESYDFPYLTLRVACSKGTYIRTLFDDIGQALGTVAHMTALRRTRVGSFYVADSSLPEPELTEAGAAIVDPSSAVTHLPIVQLGQEESSKLKNGIQLNTDQPGGAESALSYVRLLDEHDRFFAIGKLGGGRLRVERILHL